MTRTDTHIQVSAPSRLHFGLFSIGDLNARKYGGVGVMINHPRTIVELFARPSFQIDAAAGIRSRINRIVVQWLDRFGGLIPATGNLADLPVQICVKSTSTAHCGLGSGTQLTFAVAAGLFQFFDLPMPSPIELGIAMGRASRSAIGSYGFFYGGFLVDRGISPKGDLIAPLDFQAEFPWPILVAVPVDSPGLYGTAEKSAFASLPPTPPAERTALVEIVKSRMVPALLSNDFSTFAAAVTEVGLRSGGFYASIQGGPYSGPKVTQVVNAIQGLGEVGVGQSSWGPAVFAIFEDFDSANHARDQLLHRFPDCRLHVTNADNCGARVRANRPPVTLTQP